MNESKQSACKVLASSAILALGFLLSACTENETSQPRIDGDKHIATDHFPAPSANGEEVATIRLDDSNTIDPLSQLRLVPRDGSEPGLGSAVSIQGFPALSESGHELAILKSIDAHQGSAILEISSVADKRLLKRFVLLSDIETEGAWNEHIRQRLESDMTEPNTYLENGKFKVMEQLFDLSHTLWWNYPRPPVWKHAHRNVRVSYQYGTLDAPGSILTITPADSQTSSLHIDFPVRKFGPLGNDPENYCYNRGTPQKGWISPAEDFVVIYVTNTSGRDACDEPEEWLVERLQIM